MSMSRRPVATGMHHDFIKGVYRSYRSVSTFHVGAHENLQIYENDIVEFDGYTLRIGHDEYSAPSLRGAVKSGWLVPEGDTTSVYNPRPAGVVMSPADTAKSKESQVVGHAVMSSDERVVGDRQQVRQAASQKSGKMSSKVVTVDAGIEIGRVNVPAKHERVELTRSNAHILGTQAMSTASDGSRRATLNLDPEALRKLTESEEDTSGMTEEELAEWEATKERRQLAALQAEAIREARKLEFQKDGKLGITEHDPKFAAAQQKTLSEVRGTYTGAVPFDEGNVQETAQALQAMDVPNNAVVATQVSSVVNAPKIPSRVVRTSVGVDWELGREPHVRMQDAVQRFGWSKDILLAIAAVEEDSVARFLSYQAGVQAPQEEAKAPPAKSTKTPPAKSTKASKASPAKSTKAPPAKSTKSTKASSVKATKSSSAKSMKVDSDEVVMEESPATEVSDGTVITATGISWNVREPSHWTSRVKKAIQDFPGVDDLLSIADVEVDVVSKRLRVYVEKLQAANQ